MVCLAAPFDDDVRLPSTFRRLHLPSHARPLGDDRLHAALDDAVRLLPTSGRIAVVVPDRTRDAQLPRLLPLVLQHLPHHDVEVVFASGTHTPMTAADMRTAAGVSNVALHPHDCDAPALVNVGAGHLHPVVAHADGVLLLSTLVPHYLASWGGGAKMLIPGVASRALATQLHDASFAEGRRTPGTAAGVPLDDNPMQQRLRLLLQQCALPPVAGVCVVVDEGAILDVEGGALLAHHAALVDRESNRLRLIVGDDVVALWAAPKESSGDTVVQAHKTLLSACAVLPERATVVLQAPLRRGAGHDAIDAWLRHPAAHLATLLHQAFHISLQTAWSWRSLVERHDVVVVSALDEDDVRAFGATPMSASEAADHIQHAANRAGGVVGILPTSPALVDRVGGNKQ